VRNRWVLFCGLFLVAATLWFGAVRRPYGEIIVSSPLMPPKTAHAVGDRIRVGTFNIHGGGKEIGRENLALTAQTIRGFDLLGLNEVRGRSLSQSRNQAEHLGAEVGMAAVFAPSERRWFVGSFGNGLLSRFPILDWQSTNLQARSARSYRASMTARVAIGDRTVHVMVAHVERGEMRDAQIAEVAHRFASLAAPAILLGDFNAGVSHAQLKRLMNLPGVVSALDAAGERSGIDHIFVTGLKTTAAGRIDNEASDHPLVLTELAYPARDAP
jgi:endonuclease/exonuclease/phosphatase family metal-dependent hydrolase